jgi:excisionase family DNA binding protein
MGQILTTKELAKYLKLREETIRKYAKGGKIPARRVGGSWMFDKDKIDELLRREEESD